MKTRLKAVLPIAGLLLALASAPAVAQTTTITDLSDQALRTAIASGGTVIIAVDGTITFTNTITVTADTVLDATGHQVTISGSNAVRIFSVSTNVCFTVVNLTIANGFSWAGGGIFNQGGAVSLRGVRFEGNVACGNDWSSEWPCSGGALYNWNGTVTATNCAFFGNCATNIPNGNNFSAQGGAIFNESGQMTLCDCNFATNMVQANYREDCGCPGRGAGGAIYSLANLTVRHCLFSRNAVLGGAGYASIFDWYTWGGADATGGAIYSYGALVVNATTFASNCVAGGAGVSVPSGSGWLYGCDGGRGGVGNGGALYSSGTAILVGNTFVGNAALGGKGASGQDGRSGNFISGPGGPGGAGGSALGGAVAAVSQCLVTNCTLAYNSAAAGAGGSGGGGGTSWGNRGSWSKDRGGVGGDGGAACGGLWCPNNGPSYLVNCTLAGNAASSASGGTGGYGLGSFRTPAEGGPPEINPGTNAAAGSNGWAGGLSGAALVPVNTLLSANLPTNCWGPITDGGHNLSSDASAAFTGSGSLNHTDPLLEPLADNGGMTVTFSLLPGSPAIDAGDPTAAAPTDQRGLPRLGTPDIGAYEFWPSLALQISPLASGGFQIQVTGPGGQACRLLSSTTLIDWNTLATNQIGPDGNLVFQLDATSESHRFFRLIMP